MNKYYPNAVLLEPNVSIILLSGRHYHQRCLSPTMESQSCIKWYNVFCFYQATGSWDCTVRLWPLGKDKMEVKCLKGHSSNIHAVSFSPSALLVSNAWSLYKWLKNRCACIW